MFRYLFASAAGLVRRTARDPDRKLEDAILNLGPPGGAPRRCAGWKGAPGARRLGKLSREERLVVQFTHPDGLASLPAVLGF